jgi:hypothetical protein
MDGGTTYHFVTNGIESALAQARGTGIGTCGGRRRRCRDQGGATTVNQYLAAGLIDELRLHIVPLTLGAGTRLFQGQPLKLEQVKSRAARLVTHCEPRASIALATLPPGLLTLKRTGTWGGCTPVGEGGQISFPRIRHNQITRGAPDLLPGCAPASQSASQSVRHLAIIWVQPTDIIYACRRIALRARDH